MNLTLHEQERQAYRAGDTSTAALLRQILDLCAEQADMRAKIESLESEVAYYGQIVPILKDMRADKATVRETDLRAALVAARTLLTREGASKRALDVIEAALKD